LDKLVLLPLHQTHMYLYTQTKGCYKTVCLDSVCPFNGRAVFALKSMV